MVEMFLLVDIENRGKPSRVDVVKARENMAYTLSSIAEEYVEIEYFANITLDYIHGLNPKGIVLSGSSSPWNAYNVDMLRKFYKVLVNVDKPVLGICGGHQLIAIAYGGTVDHMRKAKPGEPTGKKGTWSEGLYCERGWMEVEILERDPLFKGLPETIIVDEGHFDEVKKPPKDFKIIATNRNCRVQAMRHKSKPVYGVQFHPNIFDEKHPHGKTVLKNFFKICRNLHTKC